MKVYTLKDPFILGDEKHEKYGWSWRSNTEDLPVQFSSHKDNIMPGTRIMSDKAEEKHAKSTGKPYLWLSGVKFEDTPTEQKTLEPFEDKPAPTFKAKSDAAYLKDITNTPLVIYNGSLNYAAQAGLNLIGSKEDRRVYLEYVKEVSEEMLSMIESIRNDI